MYLVPQYTACKAVCGRTLRYVIFILFSITAIHGRSNPHIIQAARDFHAGCPLGEEDVGVRAAAWHHTVLLSVQPSDTEKPSCCSTHALSAGTLLYSTTPPQEPCWPCLVLAHNDHMRALSSGSFRASRCGQPSMIGHQGMKRGSLVGPRDAGTAVE